MYCALIEWFLSVLQIASGCIESNIFLKSIAATRMSVLNSLLFWDVILHVHTGIDQALDCHGLR